LFAANLGPQSRINVDYEQYANVASNKGQASTQMPGKPTPGKQRRQAQTSTSKHKQASTNKPSQTSTRDQPRTADVMRETMFLGRDARNSNQPMIGSYNDETKNIDWVFCTYAEWLSKFPADAATSEEQSREQGGAEQEAEQGAEVVEAERDKRGAEQEAGAAAGEAERDKRSRT
jgi:hypothetical protein